MHNSLPIEDAEEALLSFCHFYPVRSSNAQPSTREGVWHAYSQLVALREYFRQRDITLSVPKIQRQTLFYLSQQKLLSARRSYCRDTAMRKFDLGEGRSYASLPRHISHTPDEKQRLTKPLETLKASIERQYNKQQRMFVCGTWNEVRMRDDTTSSNTVEIELYRSPWSGRYQRPLRSLKDLYSRIRDATYRSQMHSEARSIDLYVEQCLLGAEPSGLSGILEHHINDILVKYLKRNTPLLDLCQAKTGTFHGAGEDVVLAATAVVREVSVDCDSILDPLDSFASSPLSCVVLEVVMVTLREPLGMPDTTDVISHCANGHVFHLILNGSSAEDTITIRHQFAFAIWHRTSNIALVEATPQIATVQLYHRCNFLADIKAISAFRQTTCTNTCMRSSSESTLSWSSLNLNGLLLADYLLRRMSSVESVIKARILAPCIQRTILEINCRRLKWQCNSTHAIRPLSTGGETENDTTKLAE